MIKILKKLSLVLSTLTAINSASGQVVTQTLSYTGSSQTFTATGCMQATITCYGARGLNGASTASGAIGGNGGLGAMSQGVVSLTSGQVLNVFVGGVGSGTVGGFNGGGDGASGLSGAGGGASDVRLNGITLSDRIIVAGGGGGGGNAGCASATITGGNGGAGGGGNGTAGTNSQAGWGGQGGTGTTGGAFGVGCPVVPMQNGGNGVAGIGGAGGPFTWSVCGALASGGGGGGGYFGGGGGGTGAAGTTSCSLNDTGGGGGGAGGTNYFATSLTNTIQSIGVNNGNGYVVISYSLLPTPTITVNSGVIVSGQSFTIVPGGANTYTYSSGSAVVSPTVNTTYSVVGTSSLGCASSNTAVSTVVVIPPCSISTQTVNNPTPSSLCGPGSSTISLANSENGVFYFLRDNANNSIIGNPVNGNGNSISFPTGTINTTMAYNVNAVKDYGVSLPTNSDFVRFSSPFYSYTNKLTVEAWVYSIGGQQPWAGQGESGTDDMITNVWLWHGGTFYVNDNGNWASTTFPAMPTGWTHVATVADATGLYIYYNGVLVSSSSQGIVGGIRNAPSSVVEIGKDPRYFDAARNSNLTFDNFKIWNIARTATEIASDVSACNTSHSNLVLNTDFLEGAGTAILSYSGQQGQIINPTSNWVLGSMVCANCELQMTGTVTVTVNSLPVISVNSGSICAGQSFTITPTGASTYTYSNGSDVVTPASNSSYTVTGTDAVTGCTNLAVSTITVNALPVITSETGDVTVCGDATGTFSLVATNASTYSWQYFFNSGNPTSINGNFGETGYNTAVMTIPNLETEGWNDYDIECVVTSAEGCSVISMPKNIVVNTLPTLSVATTHTLLCTGEIATLSVSGASTYTWSTSENTSSVAVSPTVQTTYTVNGTDANGCENTATFIQDVSLCTGIAGLTNDALIAIYPNPNNGLFVIELTALSKVTVTNALGQIVISKSFEAGKYDLDIRNETTGVYFVKVATNKKQQIIKMIKE